MITASHIRGVLEGRGWRRIAVGSNSVHALLDGVRVRLAFQGDMALDEETGTHTFVTTVSGMVEDEECYRNVEWAFVIDEEAERVINAAARGVEIAVRVGNDADREVSHG